jgi:hypothetical protein
MCLLRHRSQYLLDMKNRFGARLRSGFLLAWLETSVFVTNSKQHRQRARK